MIKKNIYYIEMGPSKKEPIKNNEIINWYDKLKGEITKPAKVDKNFNNITYFRIQWCCQLVVQVQEKQWR